jgi:hypothetical protein
MRAVIATLPMKKNRYKLRQEYFAVKAVRKAKVATTLDVTAILIRC